jgi:hypothetical protein
MREGFSYLLVVSVFLTPSGFILFDYESRKRELKTRLIYEDRFRRGRQRLPGCVARTDAPVYMRERGGGRRGSCALSFSVAFFFPLALPFFILLQINKKEKLASTTGGI